MGEIKQEWLDRASKKGLKRSEDCRDEAERNDDDEEGKVQTDNMKENNEFCIHRDDEKEINPFENEESSSWWSEDEIVSEQQADNNRREDHSLQMEDKNAKIWFKF